jgi:hypothetical protein
MEAIKIIPENHKRTRIDAWCWIWFWCECIEKKKWLLKSTFYRWIQ